jgi:general secretion pathway protein K
MTSSSGYAARAEAGFVLVAVLWILAALATLASIYSSYTVNTAAASHIADDRVQAEASIRAGVEMAVFRQLALPEKARPTGGGFDIRVGRTGVSVRFRSEGARIDLNAAPADLLTGLFTTVGVDPARAESFAERVVGWRTKAQAASDTKDDAANNQTNAGATNAPASIGNMSAHVGAAAKEDKLYGEQHVPYPPRHAPFENTLELSLLPGISLAVVERVLPFVTVFSGRPEVDIFSANSTVLSAFPEMTPQILGAVQHARMTAPDDGRALLELLGPAKARATTERSKALRASIAVDFDNGRRVHAEVVFRLKDKDDKDKSDGNSENKGDNNSDKDDKAEGGEPYDLLYWLDDFDGPMHSA